MKTTDSAFYSVKWQRRSVCIAGYVVYWGRGWSACRFSVSADTPPGVFFHNASNTEAYAAHWTVVLLCVSNWFEPFNLFSALHALAGKMKIVEEPNTFGYVEENIVPTVKLVAGGLLTDFLCLGWTIIFWLKEADYSLEWLLPQSQVGSLTVKPSFNLILCCKYFKGWVV